MHANNCIASCPSALYKATSIAAISRLVKYYIPMWDRSRTASYRLARCVTIATVATVAIVYIYQLATPAHQFISGYS